MAEILRAQPETQEREKTEMLSCVFIHPQTVNAQKTSYSVIDTQKLLITISTILSQKTGREIKVRGLSAEDMMKMIKER